MSIFSSIQNFLACQGISYISPAKAGRLQATMLAYKAQGQAARQEFAELVGAFQECCPSLSPERPSHWMNQAQILRPHFWNYLKGCGEISEPMLALRLYGTPEDFGVSLEVSFIERKRDEESLNKQNRVLRRRMEPPVYYLAQLDGISQRFEGNEANRQFLGQQLLEGRLRKVLVKYDVCLSRASSLAEVLKGLEKALSALLPFYEETRAD